MALGTHLSAPRFQALSSAARCASTTWLSMDPAVVAGHYNRMPFLLSHRLAEHPAFALEALLALCRRLPADQVKHRFGKVPQDAHFDSSFSRYRQGLSLDDALENLEDRQAYITIYNPEKEATYRPVIEGLLGEIALATDGLEHCFNWYSTYLFISAKDSVTPYHMDREMNFLLQIRGHKQVQLWDPNDDAVMSPAARDHLFSHGEDARPNWRDELQDRAMTFQLRPGLGVHHPFIAPHLVRTGPELSISLAITFRSPQSDRWSDAHRFNERLRRWGLPARRVGRTAWVDSSKALLIRTARHTKRLLKGQGAEA